ncbi:MAG: Phosphocholine transferase AnkX [Chlamydiae bacterium]|nr:Phosphocholine transferase AnkX [Chlamydiota bacterium]
MQPTQPNNNDLLDQQDNYYLLAPVILDENIQALTEGKDHVSAILREIKKTSALSIFEKEVRPPQELLNHQGPLSQLKNAALNPSNSLFAKIQDLSSQIKGSLASISTEYSHLLKNLIRVYDNFIQDVCKASGKKRMQLLKGPARLHQLNASWEVDQKQARQMIMRSRFGQPTSTNLYGASAQCLIGETSFKKARLNPLNPGFEFATDSLNQLIMNRGSPSSRVLKIENVWIKNADGESASRHPKKQVLAQEAADRQISYEQVFQSSPELKTDFPFDETRDMAILQVSSKVKGTNLLDIMRDKRVNELDPKGFSILTLLALITRPGDGRADNYIVGQDKAVVCIDNDASYYSDFLWHDRVKQHQLGLKCVLFLFPQMQAPVHPEVRKKILSQFPEEVLIDWLKEIKSANEQSSQLTEEKLLSTEEYNDLSYPIQFYKDHNGKLGTVSLIYNSFKKIQEVLRQNPDATHWDLLEAVSPTLEKCYKKILDRSEQDPLKAQEILFDYRDPPAAESFLSDEELQETSACEALAQAYSINLSQEKQDVSDAMGCLLLQIPTKPDFLQRLSKDASFHLLPVQDSEIIDADLLRIIREMKRVKTVLLNRCPELTKAGIIRLLSEAPGLSLVVGDLPKVSDADVKEIIEYCWKNNHPISLKLRNGHVSVTRESKNSTLYYVLLEEELKFAQGLLLLEANTEQEIKGKPLLHALAEENVPKSIAFLLENLTSTEVRDRTKNTALHWAARSGRTENLQVLLDKGTNIGAENSTGQTALHLSVAAGHMDATEFLINHSANTRAKTGDGETVLHLAAKSRNRPMLDYFIRSLDSTFLQEGDNDGKTPLHSVLRFCPADEATFEIVQTLVQAEAPIDARNFYDYTPLHWAAMFGHIRAFDLLLQTGADLNASNKNEDTPLDLAIRYGQDKIVHKLFSTSNNVETNLNSSGSIVSEYHQLLLQARSAQDIPSQVFCLEKLGDEFLQEQKYHLAANLYNSALCLVQQQAPYSDHTQYLDKKLERIEGVFVYDKTGKYSPASYQGYVKMHRGALAKLREDAAFSLKQNRPIEVVSANFTDGAKRELVCLINEAIERIGSPPTDYAVIAMGSMARREMCPFSNIKLAIVVADETHLPYFKTLAQLIELKVINMGETPFQIFREDPSITPNGFHINLPWNGALKEPSGIQLIGGPQQLAQSQVASLKEESMYHACAMDSVAMIKGTEKMGQALVKTLRTESSKLLGKKHLLGIFSTPLCKLQALRMLSSHVSHFEPSFEAEQDPAFDVKKMLYLPFLGIIESLGHYYNLTGENTLATIGALRGKKIFSNEAATALKETYHKILTLRFRSQEFYKRGKEVLHHPKIDRMISEHDLELFTIEDEDVQTLREIYSTLIPFYRAAKKFVESQGKNHVFAKDQLRDDSPTVQGEILSKFLQFEEAEQAIEPSSHTFINLAYIEFRLRKYDSAIEYLNQAKQILNTEHKTNSHPEIARTLARIAACQVAQEEPQRAIEAYQESLKIFKALKGEKTLHVAVILKNLGILLNQQKKPKETVQHLEEALAIFDEVYQSNPHPDTCTCLRVLGENWRVCAEEAKSFDFYEKARSFSERALEMSLMLYGEKPRNHTVSIYHNLGMLYVELEDFKLAKKNYENALKLNDLLGTAAKKESAVINKDLEMVLDYEKQTNIKQSTSSTEMNPNNNT